MSSYDKQYKTVNLFGEPYPELIDFFSTHPKRGRLLDLGSGQGRDAIPLAHLGYNVTAIDKSKVGIKQMILKSQKEGLKIQGYVEDIYKYNDFSKYDFILLDSMFHFYKRDKNKETSLIKRIILNSKIGTVIVFCIQDIGKIVDILNKTINSTKKAKLLTELAFKYNWIDKESEHHSFTNYQMIVIQI